jgi:transcriptional regulator with XRE-family HTH domain
VEFGQEVRRRREAAGLTLEALAERSGLTPNYIGGIEMGKRDPSLSTLLSLARGLRAPPADLLGGLAEMSPAAIEAGRLFEGTLPEIQDAVLRLLRTVTRRMG